MNLARILDGHDPDSTALIAAEGSVSYRQLSGDVDRVRTRLASRGFGKGDRLMLVGLNETDFVVATLATLGLGATVAPIQSTNPLPEMQRQISAVDPAAVLLCASAAPLLTAADEFDVPYIDTIDTLRTDVGGPIAPVVDLTFDELAFLLLTSGVANDPKVAMLSHGNVDFIQRAIVADRDLDIGSDDIVLAVLPFSHIFGLNVVLMPTLRAGATVVLQSHFDVTQSLNMIKDHQITMISGAPPMWQRWVDAGASSETFASVRHAASGASALPIETFNAVNQAFGIELVEGYGLTEASPIVAWNQKTSNRVGSVGKALPGVEIAIVDDDGTPVDAGDVGEIVVRSPGIFQGYFRAPETTAAALSDDGWFWTGDIGVLDTDDRLFIVDRIKDIIIVSGFNVYPAEVESILLEHPDVLGAIVVGTPHLSRGEAVVAYIAGAVEAAELDALCHERLSRYKCPTKYHILDSLPVASMGKPIRRELRS